MATTALREHPFPGTPALARLLEQVADGAAERERTLEAPFAAIDLVRATRLGALRISVEDGRQVGMGGLETMLVPDPAGDGFRLNGEKFYSTGSPYSDWTQIYVATPDGTIAAVTLPVDREGLSILDDWDGFGQRLTGTGTTRHDPQILQVVGEIAAQVAAAEAKVAIDAFAPRTASRLFDVGGASATQSSANLDRHWRNIRTISTHNPTINKASAVGDFFVNGTPPPRNGFF